SYISTGNTAELCVRFGATPQLRLLQSLAQADQTTSALVEPLPFRLANKTKFSTIRLQSIISVIVHESHGGFRTRRKHARRIINPVGDQIVNQISDVGFTAIQAEELATERLEAGVNARNQALTSGLFITSRTVNLAGKKQAFD